jgi:hypothetical protein
MQKIKITIILLLFSSISVFAQLKMDMSAFYNIPTSTSFNEKFQNGYGGTAELFYLINDTGFSASFLVGMNVFRATKEYEQELEDSNPTLFEYDYRIDYFTFPVLLGANYTLFHEKKFNIKLGFGAGVQFMELKKKLIGKYVSDTHKDNFNEFAIYPNLGISYKINDTMDISLKGGYNQTFGELGLSYLNFGLGLQYEI